MIETKNAKVRRLVREGEYMKALQICKDWNYENPQHKDILQRGYECKLYGSFYKQLGYDTDVAYNLAVEVLLAVYA